MLNGTLRRHRTKLKEEWFAVKKSEEKQIKELLEYFKKMNFVEIMGFGKLLQVEEKEKFEDYLGEICVAFVEKPRLDRRKLIRLAKQVCSGRK